MIEGQPKNDNGYNQKEFWDQFYSRFEPSDLYAANAIRSYQSEFEIKKISPRHLGGRYDRSFAYGCALRLLQQWIEEREHRDRLTILDVGSGFGDHTIYVASKNMNVKVVGLDISLSANRFASSLAAKLGVTNCNFVTGNITNTCFPDRSIDGIIGLGSLHHFIKDTRAPREIKRIMSENGRGFFIDSFHENPLFGIFHNKAMMRKMGDEVMTRKVLRRFWGDEFEMEIIPIDWLLMLDKLIYLARERLLRRTNISRAQLLLSSYFFSLDRQIARLPRKLTTCFAGTILTTIRPCKGA